MIDALRLAGAWGLVAACGTALLLLIERNRRSHPAWTLGVGFLAGAFALGVWMRVLSWLGLRFGVASIAVPLVVATLAMAAIVVPALRRASRGARGGSADPTPALARVLALVLATWIAARFAVLLLDVVWTPLYPWDAWIQWATKARVWYALGHIVPFGAWEAWFAANGAIFTDASPNYPATVPLWQVWSSVALGRFDDALMNVPWWLVAVSLALAIFGALRDAGLRTLPALVGAWLVSSLPLANVHVALAGYADLPMAAYYAVAAIAFWRWSQSRAWRDLLLAASFAVACTTIKTPGLVWALTLVPALVPALAPKRTRQILGGTVLAGALALLVLARTQPVVLGYRLHLDFAPPWSGLVESLFLLGNWNLLWYAVVATAIAGWRVLGSPRLAPLSAIFAAGLAFLAIVFAFTNARDWVVGQTTINRAVLHVAPLAIFWTVLVVAAWRDRLAQAQAQTQAPAPAPVAEPAA
jgi:hypothetical protein